MDEERLLERITVNPQIFAGKPTIPPASRLAVEHLLGCWPAMPDERRLECYSSLAG